MPRTVDPRFEFTDPALWRSLPAVAHDMARVGLEDHPLTATAALVWNGDLPRPLQQILFAATDSIARRRRPRIPSRGPDADLWDAGTSRVWLDVGPFDDDGYLTLADGSRT